MKKILSPIICLVLSFIASAALAASGHVLIYPETNFQGTAWQSVVQNSQFQGCKDYTDEAIPSASYGNQFSIKTTTEDPNYIWTCSVTLDNGSQICVDSEGWGNIEHWNTVVRATCNSYSYCEGEVMKNRGDDAC